MNPSVVHYQTLELKPGASQAEIKQAYRDLALVWHPDRFADNPRLREKAEEKLKQINAAYNFLKSTQPQASPQKVATQPEPKTEAKQKQKVEVKQEDIEISTKFKKLNALLELGRLKDADLETKRLLLELAGRTKEGWLRPEDIKAIPGQSLSTIDQLWAKYSNGRFGFSIQRRVWEKLGCVASSDIATQTLSENKFGQHTQWRVKGTWLSPWDSFNYSFQAPLGSLPREYVFALSGWWSYSKGWTGYLLWRFDALFPKPK
ncbi:MAG TPA: GUN4 domain-containing protein [Allocoleopsis sp.]